MMFREKKNAVLYEDYSLGGAGLEKKLNWMGTGLHWTTSHHRVINYLSIKAQPDVFYSLLNHSYSHR